MAALLGLFGVVELATAANGALHLTSGARSLEAARRNESDRALDMFRRADGPVLAYDLTLVVKANKDVLFEPFIMYELDRQGVWDARDFVRQIAAGYYTLFVAESDISVDEFIPADIRAALTASYVDVGQAGKYRFYVPRTGGRVTRLPPAAAGAL
jgi:hypothetical protein